MLSFALIMPVVLSATVRSFTGLGQYVNNNENDATITNSDSPNNNLYTGSHTVLLILPNSILGAANIRSIQNSTLRDRDVDDLALVLMPRPDDAVTMCPSCE
ncbi:hypothetical protein TELCIR_16907, partial [Teladorsagia circumcincta]